ncbi:hypothetical protein D3C76_1404910 [compost metagenome]
MTGDCDYAYATSAQPKSIDELKTILNNDFSFDHARTRQLLHYYVNGYSMASNDAKAIHERLRSWLM